MFSACCKNLKLPLLILNFTLSKQIHNIVFEVLKCDFVSSYGNSAQDFQVPQCMTIKVNMSCGSNLHCNFLTISFNFTLAGLVQRFSLGFRGPLCLVCGFTGVSGKQFLGGVAFGALLTMPLQIVVVSHSWSIHSETITKRSKNSPSDPRSKINPRDWEAIYNWWLRQNAYWGYLLNSIERLQSSLNMTSLICIRILKSVFKTIKCKADVETYSLCIPDELSKICMWFWVIYSWWRSSLTSLMSLWWAEEDWCKFINSKHITTICPANYLSR